MANSKDKLAFSVERWRITCDLLTTLCRCILTGVVAYCFFEAIKYLGTQSPEHLSGFAVIAEKLTVGTTVSISINVFFWPALWYKEYKAKKRAIKITGDLRRELERNDPQRSSSGLTSTGENP